MAKKKANEKKPLNVSALKGKHTRFSNLMMAKMEDAKASLAALNKVKEHGNSAILNPGIIKMDLSNAIDKAGKELTAAFNEMTEAVAAYSNTINELQEEPKEPQAPEPPKGENIIVQEPFLHGKDLNQDEDGEFESPEG